ncbi:MAG: Ni/Fe hydrogenase subunit alpha [Desulfurococcaceae archaeon]|jgi:coenzyme F420-reducing hydrogenase alpha subunit|nr:Ni/Fe hydrogenase subunit alpha [Desulfurococcaceae archaeon]
MSKVIKVDYLARVEGEGNLFVELSDGRVSRVEVGIFEAPRFFEAFLRGRKYYEVPDITARICGICPIAYIMSSSRALEKILGAEVPEEVRKLRRIVYLGEWIESHVLHILMLHAPDFLGYESVLSMARDYPDIVRKGMKLKGWGNQVISVVGGRSVHPVSCRVGGFHRIIRRDELLPLLKGLGQARDYARELLEWVLKLPMPDLKRDVELVSLRGVGEYPILEGRVVSNKGLNVPEDVFENILVVEQAKYSTSLRYALKDRGHYVVGPLARYNNNYDLLDPEVRGVVESYGYGAPLHNSFQSIIARAAEVYHAVLELEELISNYREPQQPYVEGVVRRGVGAAITEAPRGMLYHRYEINERGYVINANIIPPTSQNLASIEEDLLALSDKLATLNLEEAQWLAEQTIRNYDPCISCATHFLKIRYVTHPKP